MESWSDMVDDVANEVAKNEGRGFMGAVMMAAGAVILAFGVGAAVVSFGGPGWESMWDLWVLGVPLVMIGLGWWRRVRLILLGGIVS